MSRIIENPKELILSTASKLAHTEGIASLNMRKVASECDIALGTIYNYFPTKMDLTIAIIEDFWNDCFREFHHAYDSSLDFFKQLEVLYFYMFNYLEQFRGSWLKDLSSLPDLHKKQGKAKELAYMEHFLNIFEELIESHHIHFDATVYVTLGKKRLLEFIFSNFISMLKNNQRDYEYFDLILKRILLP
ncbi:MAG: TetR/AcrR family transcriptional regulator [Niameybacter sp.]|uniref:TetR/AcrR family transcriptional regulator n=1 Tax=Niameybacter sp. TaxID=2033640 RepID=UPI002FC7F359